MKKNLKEIDSKEVNEVVSLTKKILNLLYIVFFAIASGFQKALKSPVLILESNGT